MNESKVVQMLKHFLLSGLIDLNMTQNSCAIEMLNVKAKNLIYFGPDLTKSNKISKIKMPFQTVSQYFYIFNFTIKSNSFLT